MKVIRKTNDTHTVDLSLLELSVMFFLFQPATGENVDRAVVAANK